jgi:hypothetical protein
MNPEMGCQLCHRRIAAQRGKCDLGLESRLCLRRLADIFCLLARLSASILGAGFTLASCLNFEVYLMTFRTRISESSCSRAKNLSTGTWSGSKLDQRNHIRKLAVFGSVLRASLSRSIAMRLPSTLQPSFLEQ